MKFLKILGVLTFSILTLWACNMKDESILTLRLQIDRSPSMQAAGNGGRLQPFSGPATITDFNCIAVNVVSEDIPSLKPGLFPSGLIGPLRGGATCTYPGIMSPPLSMPTAGGSVEIQLQVPRGPHRLIQVLGIYRSGCASTVPFAQLIMQSSDPVNDYPTYELGRATVDVYGSTYLSIPNTYSTSKLAICNSSGGGSAAVTVTPNPSQVASGGSTLQLTAMTTDANGSPLNVTASAAWTTSNPSIATVSSGGLVTSGSNAGIVIITATYGTEGGGSAVHVMGVLNSIPVGTSPVAAYYRPGSPEVWVLNNGSHDITIINSSNYSTSTVDLGVGYSPNELVFIPDGLKAFVSTSGTTNTIKIIDANDKSILVTHPTSAAGIHLAVTGDGTKVFYGNNVNSPEVKGVYKILTSTNSFSVFDPVATNHPLCPTGVAVSGTTLIVSDQCHGGSDQIFAYPNLDPSSISTALPISSYTAGPIYISPDGIKLFTSSGNSNTYMYNTTTLTGSPAASAGAGGPILFLGFGKAIWGKSGSTYQILDLTAANPLSSSELPGSISSGTNGTMPAVNPAAVLFLPVTSTGQVKAYQF